MRSGLLTIIVLTLVLAGLAFGWHEHRLGQFAQLKKNLANQPIRDVTLRPGGQDFIQLQRSQLLGGSEPEFLSATLFPGRGMNLFQITAYLPQKGEVNLLASPPLEEAARLLSGKGSDATGAESLAMGAMIEVPWAGRIFGTSTPNEKDLVTMWRGMHLILPTDTKDSYGNFSAMAAGGLLLKRPSDTVTTNVMPDGGGAQATFRAGDFDGHWPSKTDITTTVSMSGRAIDIRWSREMPAIPRNRSGSDGILDSRFSMGIGDK
jgi:hypothetical protein